MAGAAYADGPGVLLPWPPAATPSDRSPGRKEQWISILNPSFNGRRLYTQHQGLSTSNPATSPPRQTARRKMQLGDRKRGIRP